MGSVCAEQHHKFHTSHQLQLLNKKSLLREIDIPPRKLLNRRACGENVCVADVFAVDSPRSAEEAFMQKYLPYNDAGDDTDSDSDDPYSSDHFRMYEFKVRRCTRSRSHDWTDCPFAHPGEKARRRDPRRHHYSGTVCAEFRRGGVCSRGDNCEFAHGVFECWLHPARYRTEACKDGRNCKRKVCFFAHSPRQLRLLPPQSAGDSSPPEGKFRRNNPSHHHHCCLYCHSPVSASPTSTLMGGPHFSSPISRYGDRFSSVDPGYNKDSLSELICSLEGMNLNMSEVPPDAGGGNSGNLSWVDVCLSNNFDDQQQQQQQFVLSPCTPSPSGSGGYFSNFDSSSSRSFNFEDQSPDLGWVNDLLT